MELCGERYAQDYGLRIMALRFSTVYGSQRDNPNKLIPKLISRALKNQDITIDNGLKTFDFIHQDDLIDGMLSGIDHLRGTQIRGYFDAIPLCTGEAIDLEQLARLIISKTNSASELIIEERQEEKYLLPNPQKAKDILDFETEINFETGIRETVKKFKMLFVHQEKLISNT